MLPRRVQPMRSVVSKASTRSRGRVVGLSYAPSTRGGWRRIRTCVSHTFTGPAREHTRVSLRYIRLTQNADACRMAASETRTSFRMDLGMNAKGWTVVDCDDGPSLCALSVKTAVRTGKRPQVLAVAEAPRADEAGEPQLLRDVMRHMDRGLPTLIT